MPRGFHPNCVINDEIIDELVAEYGVEKEHLKRFLYRFIWAVCNKIRTKVDFKLGMWGEFQFHNSERLEVPTNPLHKNIIKVRARKVIRKKVKKWEQKQLKVKRKKRIVQKKVAKKEFKNSLREIVKTTLLEKRKDRAEYVNNLFLHKLASELDYVLSLYH